MISKQEQGRGCTEVGKKPDLTPNFEEIGMKEPAGFREKRRYPRILLKVPVDLRLANQSRVSPGMVINASEGGMLVQTFGEIPVRRKVQIQVLLLKDSKLTRFRAGCHRITKFGTQ